jgi:anti-anti-sigma factor
METRDSKSILFQINAVGGNELKLAGDINVCLSSDLHGECVRIARQGKDAVVDCEDVDSFDTAALQIFTALKSTLALQGRKLQFTGLSPELAETVELAGLIKQLLGDETT